MYDRLFVPLRLGNVLLANRIARSAHLTGMPWLDVDDSMLAYHEARAKGGVGMSILEISGVHETSPSAIPAYRDDVRSGLSRLADMAHSHGMVLFQQLWHGGSSAPRTLRYAPRWSASDVPNPASGAVAEPMTQAMIDEIVEAFAMAARRSMDAGIDGVELHAAHGYLFSQFLSPLTNNRTDGYGGDLVNRARFLREVIAAVRASTAPEYPIAVKLSSADDTHGGTVVTETAEVARLLGRTVQLIDVSTGSYYNPALTSATMEAPLGYELPVSDIVTAAAEVDTMVNGRIMTLEQADAILAEGRASLVSMVRALIADPELVRKTMVGREAQVRPCTSSNQGCLGNMARGLRCVNNPEAGLELDRRQLISGRTLSPRRVVVVGGGPAGLEAARTAALVGHEVTVLEMRPQLGGQLAIASRAPYRSDLTALVRWYADELERLGAAVRLRCPVDHEDVLALSPDVVIVATGSSPRDDGFQIARPASPLAGHTRSHVHTSWEVLSSRWRPPAGSSAVVFDDLAEHEGVAVAEHLLAMGCRVVYATRFSALGERVPGRNLTAGLAYRRLRVALTGILTDVVPIEIRSKAVSFEYLHGGAGPEVDADIVVLVGRNRPNRELYAALPAEGPTRIAIGDANGSFGWQRAVQEGRRAGLAVGVTATSAATA
ncbi:NADH:flavin oxidoreductase / NADH oxidase [Mycobacterium saskatchewanense]|uniref:Uncharacterized protein n=1 Tax=Mycobacterium saskatchewanense TaxID=220927 RepID=A0AAJ3NR71_9MYCO|nr:FAD-dependent oxidoreductase [Mycobacterium saskatchewanense]ORW72936.1 hypothetical protein AWC23_08770 [Mycobacterium saskatchewanense]BBX62533.1 NADH:flavin oxidoreductase / NADH oxidase [Mycobacterium saskatchewanense]